MKRIATLASAALLALAVAACGAANANGPSASAVASVDPNAVHVTAKDFAFKTPGDTAPAGNPFQIAFDNEDGAPHNVSIVAADGTKAFDGAIVSGPTTTVYSVPALPAGTYHLKCDVHPDMDATLTVR